MFFQIIPDIVTLQPFIFAILLIISGMIILKIGLAVTKAESNTNFKWIAGSFFIQYGVSLFISAPMLLNMVLALTTGSSNNYRGPDPGSMAMSITFSILISVNLINMIHKPGIKRSIVIALLIVGPIFYSSYLIFSNLGNVL